MLDDEIGSRAYVDAEARAMNDLEAGGDLEMGDDEDGPELRKPKSLLRDRIKRRHSGGSEEGQGGLGLSGGEWTQLQIAGWRADDDRTEYKETVWRDTSRVTENNHNEEVY
nr:hypothetical protein Iba_chr13bCG4380 [Ipomoea batatas]